MRESKRASRRTHAHEHHTRQAAVQSEAGDASGTAQLTRAQQLQNSGATEVGQVTEGANGVWENGVKKMSEASLELITGQSASATPLLYANCPSCSSTIWRAHKLGQRLDHETRGLQARTEAAATAYTVWSRPRILPRTRPALAKASRETPLCGTASPAGSGTTRGRSTLRQSLVLAIGCGVWVGSRLTRHLVWPAILSGLPSRLACHLVWLAISSGLPSRLACHLV